MITGIAYSILLFAIAIAAGLWLGKFKIKGVSIGATWILFLAIVMGHFGLMPDAKVLSFMKDFGLILFVYSIGLQVGPGFFSSFRSDGVRMNIASAILILFAAATAFVIHLVTGESLTVMVGVMSGAVTNTPGLGAAQQTLIDGGGNATGTSMLASAYAVAYPIGVIGVLFLLILYRSIFKVDISREAKAVEAQNASNENTARRMHCMVTNPGIFGKAVKEVVTGDFREEMVISRMMRDGREIVPDASTVFEEGDLVLIVTSQKFVDRIRMVFGQEVSMHHEDWKNGKEVPVVRRLGITDPKVTGKNLSELLFRTKYGVVVTRVVRSGVELVATNGLRLQLGDFIQVVGPESGIAEVAKVVGNKASNLDKPNLIPIFIGIALGIVLGCIPIAIPGIPQPIKLGLAGGPLIVAILLSAFGTRLGITTYTTNSANLMVREIGISFFLAAVGFGAGETFVSSLMGGGWWWILYGALITIVPVILCMLLCRYVFKLNFFQVCGIISGGTTNPPVLAFAQGAYGSEYTSVNYATVYPLAMFLRVLVAQVMILIAL